MHMHAIGYQLYTQLDMIIHIDIAFTTEILGGLFSVLSIWIVTAVLLFIAIQRITSNDYEIHSNVMLITSGCAVVVNML